MLNLQVERLSSQFRSVGYLPEEVAVETSPSVKENYRSRCRFGITQKDVSGIREGPPALKM